jgi:hypothetical protein
MTLKTFMKHKRVGVLGVLVLTLSMSGCSTTNSALAKKTSTVEYYRIFDIKTTASRQAVGKAATDGLTKNVNSASTAMPIPSSGEIPQQPGRFKLVNPFDGPRMATLNALMSLSGGAAGPTRGATCEGAAWTGKAVRQIAGSSNLSLTLCLFQYSEGFHLDMYGVFTKEEGGLLQLSRVMASAMVGTPEQWTEKTFLDVVRSVRTATGAEITLLEAQPEVSGTPWLDAN